jgi:epoxyqueuosine reductase
MIRNCLIAAGTAATASAPAVERHLESDDPVVADAAKWAIGAALALLDRAAHSAR